jgi:hypothetical protein
MTDRQRAARGVRLGDLDRSQVYRIGYVVERRRWEVLGEEPATDGASRPREDGSARDEVPSTPAYRGRHATTEPDQR